MLSYIMGKCQNPDSKLSKSRNPEAFWFNARNRTLAIFRRLLGGFGTASALASKLQRRKTATTSLFDYNIKIRPILKGGWKNEFWWPWVYAFRTTEDYQNWSTFCKIIAAVSWGLARSTTPRNYILFQSDHSG